MPLIFGGIVAAMIGFIAARAQVLDPLLLPSMRTTAPDSALAGRLDDTIDRLAALEASMGSLPESDRLSALEAIVSALPDSDRLAALEDTVATLPNSDRLAALEETVAALPEPQPDPVQPPEVDLTPIRAEIAVLSDQIQTLANRPVEVPVIPMDAIDAAMADLRATSTEQQAVIDQLLADARQVKDDTEARANATLARAAMTRILSSVDNGTPFVAALGDLEQAGQTDIPQTLRDVADDGVVPLADLQETISGAARAALAAARGADEGQGGLGGFLQRQLGARSVEPRAGSDTDAILSRVEAAARAGRIGDALAEAETLPASARDALSTWIEQAQSRHDAVSAANALAERLSAL
jgi:hypothetical protein